MREALQSLVWDRAQSICEYCRIPQSFDPLPFHIDHIIALKHGGRTADDNLALACFHCNAFKGPNIAGLDSATGEVVRLFHPRYDRWNEHFKWQGPTLIGKTATGRATIDVMAINRDYRIILRASLLQEGIDFSA
jgi:hypothetical protein